MITQGMPWPILLPVAFLFLLWGVSRGTREARASVPQKGVRKKTKSTKKHSSAKSGH